ncbi:MFS transporter [Streptomyces mobaraensis NBRC 13819 = DSM 40847]|uniref:MFS transporter n=2 Tax=Streptomyces mobaraensis TaxID=35621 RepID=A0A5N5VWQ7_STRMB|nr:MFS transporter [Streptomyces mobaraensis]EME96414.1 EmrB/QacA subfamily drug resistance transporter [Streptomyces mobaraensis NBRC 13819 = DSM 40847]KAB7832653.1 MFS transporter [Streptomyces mobaraensis]QTT74241.1 MFS transporter [Streptomyces mobaraensis NBRC 13819 = DSM 40847]
MPDTTTPDPRRWKALIFIALAQLMVVLDATIVNIALPSAQADLGISDGNRQWVITAYALAFGGLLLFGGRIADLWGRKQTFVTGLIGFAAASALGGMAVNTGMLLASRALQGVFGALLAPSALSLLAVSFTEAKERAKAFGIFGAIAGGGGAVGLLLGGVFTEYLNWRWTFFVNIPFAAVAAAGAIAVIHEPEGSRNPSKLDIPGVILATLGLVSLVYGFTRAESDGWTAGLTLALFAAAVLLLGAFVLVEGKVKSPLLPLRVVADRNRGGVYGALGLASIGMFGLFLFLVFYLQGIKGYSPITNGLAFLPMIATMITGSTQIGARLMTRVPARWLMGPGFLTAALGMAWLTQIDTDTSYVTGILPGLLLMGIGMGTAFMPAMSLATHGVQARDAGVASAMVNTSQQVGGAIGTALLNTLANSAKDDYVASHRAGATTKEAIQVLGIKATVHSFQVGIAWATGILTLAALVAVVFVNAGRPNAAAAAGAGDGEGAVEDAVPVMAH